MMDVVAGETPPKFFHVINFLKISCRLIKRISESVLNFFNV